MKNENRLQQLIYDKQVTICKAFARPVASGFWI